MAIIYALLCVVAWSCIPVMAKLSQSGEAIDNYQLLFWSNLLSTLAIAPFAVRERGRRKQRPLRWQSLTFTAVLGFLGCCFYYLCLYYGYARANSVDVLIVQYSWPASMAILGVLLLREALTVNKITGIAFGFAAAIIVISKGDFSQLTLENPRVLLIVLLGATGFALFSVLSKKNDAFSPSVSVFLYFAFATLFALLAMLWQSEWRFPPQTTWLAIALNGIFLNGLSYILWIKALSQADASKIAPLVYFAPVLSVIWLMLIFREPFYSAYAVGIALTVLSGLVISRKV